MNGYLYKKGFTLIEMLVSVALFSIVMMICVSTLLALVDANRKAQNVSMMTTNLHFALDLMSRTFRTGVNYFCIDGNITAINTALGGYNGTSYQNCAGGGSAVAFVDQENRMLAYIYDSGAQVIYRVRDTNGNKVFDDPAELSNREVMTEVPQLKVLNARFFVANTERYTLAGNREQPYVRILMEAQAGGAAETASNMSIQTTVVQRVLDI